MKDITTNRERINGSWNSWGHHVLGTLEKLETKIDKIEKQQHECQVEYKTQITAIKTKAGIVGVVAGTIGSIIIAITVSVVGKYLFISTFEDEIKEEAEEQVEEQVEEHSHNMYRPLDVCEFLKNKRG